MFPPGSVAGKLLPQAAAELGLPAGVPVSVGANDQMVGAIGAGNVRPGLVTETTGTALALIATTPTYSMTGASLLASTLYPSSATQ